MTLALQGLALFAFIPLVLFLYLRQPLGPGASILAGLVIMFGHRFVAAPWMAHHATGRCLWCGRAIPRHAEARPWAPAARRREALPYRSAGDGGGTPVAAQDFSPVRFQVTSGGRAIPVAACCVAHRDHAARFLTFISRRRAPIAAGIFVPLLLLLSGSLALEFGRPFVPHEWNTWQFKTIVALTVVLASIAYRFNAQMTGETPVPQRASTGETPVPRLHSPFPLHNLFLLGIRNTLWVFRLVGAWWLVAGLLQVLQR